MFIIHTKGENKMDYIFWGTIAMKLGKELYIQLFDLIGPSIPTWDVLAIENAELAAWIEAEKNKP
jgi:hypothetical protein